MSDPAPDTAVGPLGLDTLDADGEPLEAANTDREKAPDAERLDLDQFFRSDVPSSAGRVRTRAELTQEEHDRIVLEAREAEAFKRRHGGGKTARFGEW